MVETTPGVASRQRSSVGLLAWLVRVGATTDYREAAAIRQTQRTREAAERLDPAPGLLVLEADGAMIQATDSWHEVKLGMVAGWEGYRLIAPSYAAARKAAIDFGPRLATEAARWGAQKVER